MYDAIFSADDCQRALTALLGGRGERGPIESLVEDPRIDAHRLGGLGGLDLLLRGRQEDQHGVTVSAARLICRCWALSFWRVLSGIRTDVRLPLIQVSSDLAQPERSHLPPTASL